MTSYRAVTKGARDALDTLLALRRDGERQAELAMAASASKVREARAEEDRLEAAVAEARAGLAAARRDGGGGEETAAEAQVRRRFWARLERQIAAAGDALTRHRGGALARALAADETARATHRQARQRREVVERAITRRRAAQQRDRERRAEAALDDLPRRR
jgi:hypothetical protein